jgi:ABC-type phosphate/phosphonate transport system substrate-binding protein
MYDWPEVAWANDELWTAIAERLNATGIAAPSAIDRAREADSVWRDPGLVVSQTCGLPFSTRLRGMVRLVAVPAYAVAGCEGPRFSSMIIARSGEPVEEIGSFAGRRFAYNNADSLSGHVVLRVAMKEAGLNPTKVEWIETGSHRGSIRAVAGEGADIAAIDAVCWALALRHEAESASRLKVIAVTPLRPGLPLVTAVGRSNRDVATIRAALSGALSDPATKRARDALRIVGLGALDEWDYAPIAALARHLN